MDTIRVLLFYTPLLRKSPCIAGFSGFSHMNYGSGSHPFYASLMVFDLLQQKPIPTDFEIVCEMG